jgi:hypothetical protein
MRGSIPLLASIGAALVLGVVAQAAPGPMFAPPVEYEVGNGALPSLTRVAIGDLNGDRMLGIVVTEEGSRLYVLLNQGRESSRGDTPT